MPQVRVAVAWLLEEDWLRWKALEPDLPSYDQWLSRVETAIEEVEKRGQVAEKVVIDPYEYFGWCRARDRKVERSARAQYVADVVSRRMDNDGRQFE